MKYLQRKDKERREEEEDERWKEKMMQKFAEDDKLGNIYTKRTRKLWNRKMTFRLKL